MDRAFLEASATNDNNIAAMWMLCVFHVVGIFEKDCKQARVWYDRATRQGGPLTDAADADPFLLSVLALLHAEGFLPEHVRDAEKAIALSERASVCGNAFGQFVLGRCHHKGTGVPQDFTKAVELYQKAEKGNAWAQHKLGVCHSIGHGVPQDFTMAAALYQKAAEQGHLIAKEMLKIL